MLGRPRSPSLIILGGGGHIREILTCRMISATAAPSSAGLLRESSLFSNYGESSLRSSSQGARAVARHPNQDVFRFSQCDQVVGLVPSRNARPLGQLDAQIAPVTKKLPIAGGSGRRSALDSGSSDSKTWFAPLPPPNALKSNSDATLLPIDPKERARRALSGIETPDHRTRCVGLDPRGRLRARR